MSDELYCDGGGANTFFQEFDGDVYSTDLDLTGKLSLWETRHEVLVGFNYLNRTRGRSYSGWFYQSRTSA
ncbi:MAG: hypothetical protein ACREX9_16355 [Gammaproteobacteria bacterium]